MTLEIRLTTPARLDEALRLPADAIGIGQEGCLAKLPDAATLRAAFDRIRAAGRAGVLVAPIAWHRSADALLERLRQVAADGPLTIAVNDIGTAIAMASDLPPEVELVAGLALTRARPHSGEPDAGPPPPTLDTGLLELLRRHRITAVEIDTETSFDPTDDRWQVRQLVGVTPVGYARSCPTARQHRTGPPGCDTLCDTPYTITAHQRWQLNHGHREPVPANTVRPTLTVWGNAVYHPATAEATASYRILDARWHTPDQLTATVHALTGEVTVPAGR